MITTETETAIKDLNKMSVEDLSEAIVTHYRDLVDALVLLGDSLREDAANGLPCWVQTPSPSLGAMASAEERAIDILQLLTYARSGHGDSRRTETRFGLIGASAYTLEKVAGINKLKYELKETLKALKEKPASVRGSVTSETVAEAALQAISRAPIVHKALANAQLKRLHIKQSTRKIQVLNEQPLRMAFTLSAGSHIVERLTREKALQLAGRHNNESALQRLGELAGHTHIARYRSQSAHVRCNITYADRTRVEERPNQVGASLPIFYPYHPDVSPVKHNGGRVEKLVGFEDKEDERLPRSSSNVDLARPVSEPLGLYLYLE